MDIHTPFDPIPTSIDLSLWQLSKRANVSYNSCTPRSMVLKASATLRLDRGTTTVSAVAAGSITDSMIHRFTAQKRLRRTPWISLGISSVWACASQPRTRLENTGTETGAGGELKRLLVLG